jgi:hypothetical protein
MRLVETSDDFRVDAAHEWEGTRWLSAFQLDPTPRDEADVMGFGKAGPELAHGIRTEDSGLRSEALRILSHRWSFRPVVVVYARPFVGRL